MEFINNLIFVFTNSAYFWLAAFVFAMLGIWQGYHYWGRWKKELHAALEERKSLQLEVEKLSEEPSVDQVKVSDPAVNPVEQKPAVKTHPQQLPFNSIFRGEFDIIDTDEQLGIIYTKRPEKVDDLTRLSGVDPIRVAKLNEAGIFMFKQLASLDQVKRSNVAKRFGNFNWDELMTFIVGPEFTFR